MSDGNKYLFSLSLGGSLQQVLALSYASCAVFRRYRSERRFDGFVEVKTYLVNQRIESAAVKLPLDFAKHWRGDVSWRKKKSYLPRWDSALASIRRCK